MPKSKKLDLDVIIVNWNSGNHLHDCLMSIDAPVKSVIIVDNGSVDDSLDQARTFSKKLPIKIVESGENLGFGKACNLGVSHSKARNILFLNPDMILGEGALAHAYDTFIHRKDVNILGIQLRDKHGNISRSCANFPRSYRIISQILGWDRIIPAAPRHFMSNWDHKTSRFVPQVMGAFFMTTRLTFDQMGGFDERFFMYYEEVDFAYRGHLQGLRSYFLADVFAYHIGGGSSSKVKDKRLYYSLRSRIQYAFKHFGCWDAFLVTFFTLFVEPFTRTAHVMLSFESKSLKMIWRGYKMLFGDITKILKHASTSPNKI